MLLLIVLSQYKDCFMGDKLFDNINNDARIHSYLDCLSNHCRLIIDLYHLKPHMLELSVYILSFLIHQFYQDVMF